MRTLWRARAALAQRGVAQRWRSGAEGRRADGVWVPIGISNHKVTLIQSHEQRALWYDGSQDGFLAVLSPGPFRSGRTHSPPDMNASSIRRASLPAPVSPPVAASYPHGGGTGDE